MREKKKEYKKEKKGLTVVLQVGFVNVIWHFGLHDVQLCKDYRGENTKFHKHKQTGGKKEEKAEDEHTPHVRGRGSCC